MSSRIAGLSAREILDSRGRPTVEVLATLSSGAKGRASVPSGISTGTHEAVELRDSTDSRYRGLGVRRAVSNVVDVIAPAVTGLNAFDQTALDRALIDLDGTADKSRLGANAILAVSLAVVQAAASETGNPLWQYLSGGRKPVLPRPMVNILSGGLHAGGNLDFQDLLIIPVHSITFSDALQTCVRFYWAMKDILQQRGLSTLRADEGGFGPALRSHSQALDLMVEAAEHSGLTPGEEVQIAVDVAASHFFDPTNARYRLKAEGIAIDSSSMIEFLTRLVDRYPICAIEDGLAEDDWTGWGELTSALGLRVQLIGDDLFTTNAGRLRQGIDLGVGNSVLVKPNQVGTLTETLEFVEMAKAAGYRTVASARSGETEDATLADIAVGTAMGQVKIGSVTGSERLAKYNQLLRIEEDLGEAATLAPFLNQGR